MIQRAQFFEIRGQIETVQVARHPSGLFTDLAPGQLLDRPARERLHQIPLVGMQLLTPVEGSQRGGIGRSGLLFHHNTSVCLVFLMGMTAAWITFSMAHYPTPALSCQGGTPGRKRA